MIRRRRSKLIAEVELNTSPIHEPEWILLWAMRCMFNMGLLGQFLKTDGFGDENIAKMLEMDDLIENYDKAEALSRLKVHYDKLEKRAARGKLTYNKVLSTNIGYLRDVIDMSEVEVALLVFFCLMESEKLLSDICGYWMDDLSYGASVSVLAEVLGVDSVDVMKALSGRSKLVGCGLVSVCSGSCQSVRQRYDVLAGFSNKLLSPITRVEDFLSDIVRLSKSPTLQLPDYCHVEKDVNLILSYLKSAFEDERSGSNVLVYGPPGTGKSELVRLLATELGLELFEVASEDDGGNIIKGSSRLRAYKAAQQFFSNRRSFILFDEVQDVFDNGMDFFGKSTAQLHKAEMNLLLEENPLPAFWLSNSVSCMDPAFVRRFDIVMELDVPPLSRRKDILQSVLKSLPVQPSTIQRFANHPHLSPAVVQRAAAVIKAVRGSLSEREVPLRLESLFNQTLKAQGYDSVQKAAANELPVFYDPQFVNADIDLMELAAGIRRNPSARICLYGPPGTGKSAFAQWLAQQLQRPFHNKKLSDILSMWVGGTEKNLKKAFYEAEQDNAVLLLDEVDSFLQDRRQVQHGWELTQVNEMLVQMESFNGLFIASTNLMDNLDQAALRRFDLKIKLGYLQPDQAWRLFLAQCESMCLMGVDAQLEANVKEMTLLTPGDFAAVQRRHRFHPVQDANALLAGLMQECGVKEEGRVRRIGFV